MPVRPPSLLQALKHDTHQAHWIVVGRDFYQLHEFHGELYIAIAHFVDKGLWQLRSHTL